MKKLFKKIIVIMAITLPLLSVVEMQAQKKPKPLVKPKDIGLSEFDAFKNNSFTIYSKTKRIEADAKLLDKDIKAYSADLEKVSIEKLKKDYKAVKSLQKQIPTLDDKIEKVYPQSEALLKKAKNVTPKQKSLGAVGNTNKSVKALNESKQNMKDITALLKEDNQILLNALKDRGEEVEETPEE
ncbi:MAG: hypothetical protein KAI79_14505, partial [Bacteroidales bacterium]|nr:hypothetical protein [Bacteroidales bacterium]